jgi:uncharacterized protein (TIGR03437 family)
MPENVDAAIGKPVSFTFSASDPGGYPVALSASGLPDGASFESGTGRFSWTPGPSQQGIYRIRLAASDTASGVATGYATIAVDAGKPWIAGIRNAASGEQPACSPGSVASVTGRWLAASGVAVSDAGGGASELGGTRVKVNGEYVPVVYASARRVDFVCPEREPGTVLQVSVENGAGKADSASTTMYAMAPGLYSVDGTGTGQGSVTLAGTTVVAAGRDYLGLGRPAEPGEWITIRATGIAGLTGALPTVKIGDGYAQVESVQAAPGTAGVYLITVEAPLGTQDGDAVPVVVILPPDEAAGVHGAGRQSNAITIAVERSKS